MLPERLILVRHGESEGNIANKEAKEGNQRLFTPEYLATHSSKWRLTKKGIMQSQTAGAWLKEQCLTQFDRWYVSEHLRAMETAAHLELPEAKWFLDFRLRERDRGIMDVLPPDEYERDFARHHRQRQINRFYWAPEGGESIAQMCERLHGGILSTLHRENGKGNVIIVCHGEIMWGFRILLEKLTGDDFIRLDSSRHPYDEMHNCQILEYSRSNPDRPEEIRPYPGWKRSVCPWNQELSSNSWQEIVRPCLTNLDLMRRADTQRRFLE